MAKDTYYFTHDYNARSDSKIRKLLTVHGYTGYGLFWAIIEDLYNNANALPTDYDSIAYDLRTEPEKIRSILHDFDLFVFEVGFFGSASVERRLNERNEKSKKARESALNRWNKRKENANALPTQSEVTENGSEGNAIKERKEKEIESTISSTNVELVGTADQYSKLVKDAKSITEFIKQHRPKYIEPYMDLWNLFCDKYGTSKVLSSSETRKRKLKVRLSDKNFHFDKILKAATEQKFALESKWFNFDFIIGNDTNYIKILEGKYATPTDTRSKSEPEPTFKSKAE